MLVEHGEKLDGSLRRAHSGQTIGRGPSVGVEAHRLKLAAKLTAWSHHESTL
jgi:hypothetical protein